ncbi:MAG TPA: heme-copper oxidase subunit III [Anaeromyxobacteraceae bacterium]|jgi:heme/copper-type cytochrome/quinol oxidase subunit 3
MSSEHHPTSHGSRAITWPPDQQFGAATPGKIGMWIFLLADALSFAGLLLAYGILRSGAAVWRHPGEPPLGINFTAGLTFLLICSSVTMVLAYAAATEGKRTQTAAWLALTALGGTLFLAGQFHEYFGIWGPGLSKEGLVFGQSAYASTFYSITSFHGAHVFSGTLYILVILARWLQGKTDAAHVEILGLFWHFVDLVWILVFTFVYLIP